MPTDSSGRVVDKAGSPYPTNYEGELIGPDGSPLPTNDEGHYVVSEEVILLDYHKLAKGTRNIS